jgi:hypothetical protein
MALQFQPSASFREQPILLLGMAGFDAGQRAAIAGSLKRPGSNPRWRLTRFGEADAWLVNGTNVELADEENVRILPALSTEEAVDLNLSEVDRPVAFALPVTPPDFEPRCTFDAGSEASIHGVLLQFETWLRLVRARFVLGSHIVRLGSQLRHGIFHVSKGGQLLAVLDFRSGKAGVSPKAHPVDLNEAHWDQRPIRAADIPSHFIATSPAELTWTYVQRTDRDMLPPRYRTETVYFRKAPKVPLRWLHDSQLAVLRELTAEPGSFADLPRRTGFDPGQINHDLTCLYYAGAITTTRAKASSVESKYDSDLMTSRPAIDSDMENDRTVNLKLKRNLSLPLPVMRDPSQAGVRHSGWAA